MDKAKKVAVVGNPKEMARVIATATRPRRSRLIRQSLPDMPKYQPCPECHKGSKRDRKTLTGAFYKCPNHGEFLVVGRR